MMTIAVCVVFGGSAVLAQSTFQFSGFGRLTNRETFLNIVAPTGQNYQVDVSSNLLRWDVFLTFVAASNGLQYTDSASPVVASRGYRARQVTGVNIVTGEH